MKRLILSVLVLLLACAPAAGQRTARIKWDQIEPAATLTSVDAATAAFTGHVEAASVGRLSGGHLTFPAGQGVRVLDAGGSAAGLTVSPPTRLGSTLKVAGDVWVATGAAVAGNPSVWFTDTQRLRFEKANDRFHFDDDLYVFGYVEVDGLIATWGDWIDFRRLSSGTMGLRFYPDWVGAPGTFHSFAHNGTLFNVSDSLNVQGNTSSQGNVLAYANVNIDYDESSNTPRLVFGQSGTEYIEYNRSQDRFTFTGDVAIAGTLIYTATDLQGDNLDLAGWLHVGATATVDGHVEVGSIGDGNNWRIDSFPSGGQVYSGAGNDLIFWWEEAGPLVADNGFYTNNSLTVGSGGTTDLGGTLRVRGEVLDDLRLRDGDLHVGGNIHAGTETAWPGTRYLYWYGTTEYYSYSDTNDQHTFSGNVLSHGSVTSNAHLVLANEGELRFSDAYLTLMTMGPNRALHTFVNGSEVLEASSVALFIKKPMQTASPIIAPSIGHSALGGTIFFHEQDTNTADGVLIIDDNIILARFNREYGTVVDATLTVGGHATIDSASVTGNLMVGGTATFGGDVRLDSGAALFASALAAPTGSDVSIGVFDLGTGTGQDGISFSDNGPMGYWNDHKGFVINPDGVGLTVDATALFSATATFDAPVVLTANSGIQMATKAWSRFLAPWEIECATRGSEPGLLVPSGGTAARFQGDGKVRIPLPMPNDILGGKLRLTKVVVQVATGHASSYITASRPWKRELSGTVAFGSPLASEDTSDTGNGSTGTALRQVYDAPTGASAGPIAGFYLELTSAGTASGSVDVGGIYYEGVIQ